MRVFLLFLFYGLGSVILESTWLAGWPSSLIHFNFILYAVITLALLEEQRGNIFIIVVLGVLMDTLSSGPFGLSVFSYLIVYGFIRMIISRIMVEVWVARFVWVGLASLLEKVATGLLAYIWSGDMFIFEIFMRHALPQAVFDASLGLLMIPLLKKYADLSWNKLFKPKKIIVK
ncbi:MAG: rod shape-determining protein MreD [Pseudomonadota bacterium]